ncbi:hypothetical protein HYPGJ_30834 [Hyphomicrobium sp. GJ21]|nr:hypothetical protein HYPGJ_30834 [Hyphomicrobium sp. GJ21]
MIRRRSGRLAVKSSTHDLLNRVARSRLRYFDRAGREFKALATVSNTTCRSLRLFSPSRVLQISTWSEDVRTNRPGP